MAKNYDWSHLDQDKYEYKPKKSVKPWGRPCTHPQHDLPGHMVIPVEGYDHTCPGCGRSVHIHINRPIM